MPLIWGLLGGFVLGWLTDDEEHVGEWQGPPTSEIWSDRTTWYNPISGTNVDQYVIGGSVLVALYTLVKKYG
jgi:hypothetical protein